MYQSRRSSAIEIALNMAIGYCIAVVSQIFIFPRFGIEVGPGENFQIAMWFTAISFVRSYVIRRWFNERLHRAAERLAEL